MAHPIHQALILATLSSTMLTAVEVPRIGSMLVIGNSISRHGPSEPLGWTHDWGMAASAQEKDWVHLVQARIAANQGGTAPTLIIDAVGGGRIRGKLERLATVVAQKAELVIVQLGENENTPELIAGMPKDYDDLVAAVRAANPTSRIVCLGVWGPNAVKDGQIRAACTKHGASFASVAVASTDPACRAKADGHWTNNGVNWHPGDRGMQAYADAVWRVLAMGSDADPALAIAGPPSAATVLAEDFADGDAVAKRWSGSGAIVAGTWRMARDVVAGQTFVKAVVPAERLAGKTVRLSARVRAEGVSTRAKAWEGIRVGMIISDAEERKDWPQAVVADGTFAATTVSTVAFVPTNAVSVEVILGFAGVTGTAWFDDVRLDLVDH